MNDIISPKYQMKLVKEVHDAIHLWMNCFTPDGSFRNTLNQDLHILVYMI